MSKRMAPTLNNSTEDYLKEQRAPTVYLIVETICLQQHFVINGIGLRGI